VKTKCIRRQEFVIVGWTPSDKQRGFRSLLVGVNEDGKLRYAGKVGTGYSADEIERLMTMMAPLETKTATVEAPRAAVRGAHWIRPKLVCEVAFMEFTGDGVLRHPSYLGLRLDKKPEAVVVETEVPIADVARPVASLVKISNREPSSSPKASLPRAGSPTITRRSPASCCPGRGAGRSASSAVHRVVPRNASSRSTTPAVSAIMSARCRLRRRMGMRNPTCSSTRQRAC
jgi:hypothetical protein